MRCASSGRVGDSERVISGAVSLSSAGRVPGRHRIRNPRRGSVDRPRRALDPNRPRCAGPLVLIGVRSPSPTSPHENQDPREDCQPQVALRRRPRARLPSTRTWRRRTTHDRRCSGIRRRSRSRLGPGPPTRRHHRRTQSRTRDDRGRPTTSREGTRARASPRKLDQRRQRPPPSRTRRRRTQPSRPAGTTRRTPPHPVEPAASAGPSPGPNRVRAPTGRTPTASTDVTTTTHPTTRSTTHTTTRRDQTAGGCNPTHRQEQSHASVGVVE